MRPMTVLTVSCSFNNLIHVVTGVAVTWKLLENLVFSSFFLFEFDLMFTKNVAGVTHLYCIKEVMLQPL